MSLRSILGGGSRVKKSSPSNNKKRGGGGGSSSSSWTSSLPRTKAVGDGSNKSRSSKKLTPPANYEDDDGDDDHDNRLVVRSLVATGPRLGLRDVASAQRYIRASIFDPMPERGSGMNSTKIATVLQTRAALPPVVSASHIQALLAKSPTAAEREMAELVRAGTARRVVVPRRGGIGDLVVLSRDLEDMVHTNKVLDERTKGEFVRWLRANPAAQAMSKSALPEASQVDALVRAGFLTAQSNDGTGGSGRMGVYARPEDRSSMLSLEAVSRAAAGSLAAVGGEGALHAAGGTGIGRSSLSGGVSSGSFSVAVPGTGLFLKLVSAALDHLVELLTKTQFREMPEADLREKWDGGIAGDKEAALAKKARGEFVGILPGRTKKWRDLHGLAFPWILQEAVGAGAVEVFETRSVGRGVRLVG
ncbi:serine-threonine protein kinase 19-domain-containing protein [Apodospora peruviana]|uniref:Serine-threonine protein kinase 19-domain-containing protein n=1 Tax=Apodospora peruviana TaxID=516989 RepID=A0AAE0IR45_9PEZI|nr:serine-threonine protein kinase 19-domain-containing protein [Apodospora peruviana]